MRYGTCMDLNSASSPASKISRTIIPCFPPSTPTKSGACCVDLSTKQRLFRVDNNTLMFRQRYWVICLMFLFHDKVTRGDKIWIKIWLIVLLKDDTCRGPTLSHDFPLLLYQEIRFNCPKICNQTVKSIKIIQIRRTIVEINQGLSNFPKFIQCFPRVSMTFLQNVTILSSRGLFPVA
jgi:hypothetical protein